MLPGTHTKNGCSRKMVKSNCFKTALTGKFFEPHCQSQVCIESKKKATVLIRKAFDSGAALRFKIGEMGSFF